MATAQKIIGEGVTDPLYFTLLDIEAGTRDGTVVDLTGVTLVDMRIRSEDETELLNYDTTNDPARLEISDVTGGVVKFTPLGTEFSFEERWYNCFFHVTDASGAVIRFPSEGFFQLEIVEYF